MNDIENMLKTIPNTVSATNSEGLTIRLTQEYNERFNTGHYRYYITDSAGDIVSVSQSICGAPKGKVGLEDVTNILSRYVR